MSSDPSKTGSYLKPLLDFASETIPRSKLSSTPIFLLATAGMRLIDPNAKDQILDNACDTVRKYYKFSTSGGCDRHFRVITGELEGIYGWVTANYLMDGFHSGGGKTYGFLDMGGASTQIAFEPPSDQVANAKEGDLTKLKLRTTVGEDLNFHIFTTTFLGYGMNEARRRYLNTLGSNYGLQISRRDFLDEDVNDEKIRWEHKYKLLSRNDTTHLKSPLSNVDKTPPSTIQGNSTRINDPCLLSGAKVEEPRLKPNTSSVETNTTTTLTGAGSLDTCINQLRPLLNKTVPCQRDPCLFNGVHAPLPSLNSANPQQSVSFLGVSEYFYTTDSIFGLSGAYKPSKFWKAATQYCGQHWSDVVEKRKSGTWVDVDESRLTMQCFKSAWLITVIHYGLGIPVPTDLGIDNGANDTDDSKEPVITSINEAKGFPISWTLGAMLFHLASTIPPKGSTLPLSPLPADDSKGASVEVFAFWVVLIVVVALITSLGCIRLRTMQQRKRRSSVIGPGAGEDILLADYDGRLEEGSLLEQVNFGGRSHNNGFDPQTGRWNF
jgi:Golgi nucleoside diphosphatase